MRGGVAFHDVPQFDFFGEFDVFEFPEFGSVFDHGVVGRETHEIMDEAEDDEANAGRRRVNIYGAVLRLVAILPEVQTANAGVVIRLEGVGERNEFMWLTHVND